MQEPIRPATQKPVQEHARIEAHYDVPELTQHIRDALLAAGKRLDSLTVDDLGAIDALHSRGREGTKELAQLADLPAGSRVLDLGAGIGGSARYLAATYGCDVTGIDLTASFCETATALSVMVGMSSSTRFVRASALALPFPEASFDAVWTEHVQMNVADKHGFYSEAARVLRHGGKLIFSDMFRAPALDAHYPTPWADRADQSWLMTAEELRSTLSSLGFTVVHDIDQTERLRTWLRPNPACAAEPRGPGPLGPHVVLRREVPEKFRNMVRNLEEGRVVSVHGVWRREPG
jgi:ubiquinone/menaquinone biosynthesis C-methylase UbiE